MSLIRIILAIAISLSISGCGYNVKAIKSFQDSSTKLTNSYEEMVLQTEKWCWESNLYYRVASSSKYKDETDLRNYLKESCEPYTNSFKSVLVSKQIVNAYAEALALTAGVSTSSWNDDIANMGKVAEELKNGEGTAYLKPTEISATVKLAQFLSEIYITHEVKKETISIIQKNKDLINKHVDIMIGFANTMYPADKEFTYQGYQAAIVELKKASQITANRPIEDVIANRLKVHELTSLQDSVKNSKEAEKVISSFDVAAKSLINANNDLEKNFTTLSKDDQLESIKDFAKKVKELSDSLKALKEDKS